MNPRTAFTFDPRRCVTLCTVFCLAAAVSAFGYTPPIRSHQPNPAKRSHEQLAAASYPAQAANAAATDNGQSPSATIRLDAESSLPPSAPQPTNLAENVAANTTLAWANDTNSGSYINEVFFGTNPVPGLAEFQGSTTDSSWALPLLAPMTTYYWQIVARGSSTNAGPVWQFTTAGIHHFAWAPISSPQMAIQPFAVQITAKDAFDTTVSNYAATTFLSATGGGGVVFSADFEDGLEGFSISNTLGSGNGLWHLSTGRGSNGGHSPSRSLYYGANEGAQGGGNYSTQTANGGAVISPLIALPAGSGPIALRFNYLMAVEGASSYDQAYVEISTNSGVSFMVVASKGNGLSSNTGGQWVSNSIPLTQFAGSTILLRFRFDTRDAIANATEGWYLDDVGIKTAAGTAPLSLSPTNTGAFTQGVWAGYITLHAPSTNVLVQAKDESGHMGTSGSFDVMLANDVSLAMVDSPNPISIGEYLVYTLTVSNSGPMQANGVVVTNTLPANANFISATSSQGTCTPVAGGVTCDIGALPGAAEATIEIVVAPTLAGTALTNSATVSRAEQDPLPGNNSAGVATTVGDPLLSIADAAVSEGNIGTTNLLFDVTLSAPSAKVINVNYATTNGSAMAGGDYDSTNGILVFPAGTLSQTLRVRVRGDFLDELNEDFYMKLSNPVNAALENSQAVGTILNDDALPGQLHHFHWSPIASPEYTNVPFDVTITARDAFDNTVTNFNNAVNLRAKGEVLQGLLAYYPFEGNAHDASGNSNHGIVNGAEPASDRFGNSNSAYSFAGTPQSKITINSTNLLRQPPFSLCGWVNFSGGTGNPRIFSTAGWEVVTAGTGSVRAIVFDAATTTGLYAVWSGTNFVQATWHFVAAVYSTNALTLYVDGHHRGTTLVTDAIVYPAGFGGGWLPTVGGSAGIGYFSDSFGGSIDDLRVYNRALSVQEVNLLYTSSSPLLHLSPTNTGNFSNGAWNGMVAVLDRATNALLLAEDGVGHIGQSNPFDVVPPNMPPIIVSQPQSVIVVPGGTASFSAGADGTPPLRFQWRFNSSNIGDATNSTLTLLNVQSTNEGIYSVMVTNAFGYRPSCNASLTIAVPPTVAVHPLSRTNISGTLAAFSVSATGTPPLDYRWKKNSQLLNDGGNVSGSATATLSLSNVQDADAGVYSVTIANIAGSITSDEAGLTVVHQPQFTLQPASRTNYPDSTATFTAAATGTPPLVWQWTFEGADLPDATNSTLTLTNVDWSQAGVYAARVSNPYGSILSTNAVLTLKAAPPCLSAPMGMVGAWKGDGNVRDAVSGSNAIVLGDLAFTPGKVLDGFFFNGFNTALRIPAPNLNLGQFSGLSIEGWINPTSVQFKQPIVEWNDGSGQSGVLLWISQGGIGNGPGCLIANVVDTSNNWHYFASAGGLVVSGVFQHVGLTYNKETGLAKLYLNGAIVAQQNLGVFTPQTTYDCYFGFGTWGGGQPRWTGILDEFSFYGRALEDAEILAISANDAGGKCMSNFVPTILLQPASHALLPGSDVTLRIAASGTPPLSYQWQKDGLDLVDEGHISGVTTPVLSLAATSPADPGSYRVVVSNAFGVTISSNAILNLKYGSMIVPWGDDTYGEMNVPAGLADVTAISAGSDGYHALALRTNHTVVAWGDNSSGQTDVPAGLTDAVAVAAGGMHSLALRESGTVTAWGANGEGQTSVPEGLTGVTAITAGERHSLALKSDGTVVAWGADWYGQGSVPVGLDGVVAIAAGWAHSLALKADGTVVAWGNNDYGQLNMPLDLTNVMAIAAGDSHNLALKADGTVVAWGYNGCGEADVPLGVADVVAIAGGYEHSMALKADGTVAAWGCNNQGEVSMPSSLGNVMAIAAGYGFSLALVDKGAPFILKQPADQVATNGATVHFTVAAVGFAELGYQWQKDGTLLLDGGNVSGSATAHLSLSVVDFDDQAAYSVIITNIAGNTASATAQLTVPGTPSAPVITQVNPSSGIVGTRLGISGVNFSPVPEKNIVYFGSVRATVTAANTTNLEVTVPAGAIYAPITVIVNKLVAYAPAPFQPTFAGDGTLINPNTFRPRLDLAAADGPRHTTIGDFNGDGKPDLAVANAYTRRISLFENSHSGGVLTADSFSPRVDLPLFYGLDDTEGSPYGIVSGDVDRDGKLDILLCDRVSNRVLVYRNTGTTGPLTTNSFTAPADFEVGADPRYVRLADLDGDGRPEIVTANAGDNTLSVLPNIGAAGSLGSNSFGAKLTLVAGSRTYDVAIGDLDGDGKPDLAAANQNGMSVSLFRNLATPGNINASSFAPRTDLPAPNGPMTIQLGDIDGDGKTDVVIGSLGSHTTSVYRNIASPGVLSSASFAARVDFQTMGWTHNVALADFSGDAKPDIALVTELGSSLSVFENLSSPGVFVETSVGERIDFATGWNAWGLSAGDLDGDGLADIVFCNQYDDTISIYQNQAPLADVLSVHQFVWDPIPSPRFANAPFQVTLTAKNIMNWTLTNFNEAVVLATTNGVPICPDVAGTFVQGTWTGTVTIPQVASNLVLEAHDGLGHSGQANTIDVVAPPLLQLESAGSTVQLIWPATATAAFILESSPALNSATWTPVPDAPIDTGGQFRVPIQMSESNCFYRLRFNGP